MIITVDNIDNVLKNILQKNIKFIINNKLHKEGKFILFKYNTYFIEFILQDVCTNKKKKVEIPIPFNIIKGKSHNKIYFDYSLSTLAFNKDKISDSLKKLIKRGHNRFFNNIMEVVYE